MAKKNYLDDFSCGRIIGKPEEGHSVAEFGINKSVISRTCKAFQTTGTAIRKVGGGRPRKTNAVNDLHIVLKAIRTQYHSATVYRNRETSVTAYVTSSQRWPICPPP
ncbi:uncharacterized protein TNCV_14531 [Trichonephila clavipes]|nr:uncharacterized protein TNCV_14531 [Trichonephila clavipes]